jgi:hypothetical protein
MSTGAPIQGEQPVFGKMMIIPAAIAAICLAVPTTASAGGIYYGYPHRSYYKWPYGVTTFYERFNKFGGCHLVEDRVWTPIGWQWRRYEVCG